MELPEKIETVLVTHLRAQVQAALDDQTLDAYFDPVTQIQPGESEADIEAQLLRCICGDADQEYPQGTGNFYHPILIELLTPIADQTEVQAASEDVAESTSQLDKHKEMAAILTTAIMVDNLPATLNAVALALGAGYELTVIGILSRQPQRGQAGNLYVSGFTFRLYACGSTL